VLLAQRRHLVAQQHGGALRGLQPLPQQLIVLGGEDEVIEQAARQRRRLYTQRLMVRQRVQLRLELKQGALARGVHGASGPQIGGGQFSAAADAGVASAGWLGPVAAKGAAGGRSSE